MGGYLGGGRGGGTSSYGFEGPGIDIAVEDESGGEN